MSLGEFLQAPRLRNHIDRYIRIISASSCRSDLGSGGNHESLNMSQHVLGSVLDRVTLTTQHRKRHANLDPDVRSDVEALLANSLRSSCQQMGIQCPNVAGWDAQDLGYADAQLWKHFAQKLLHPPLAIKVVVCQTTGVFLEVQNVSIWLGSAQKIAASFTQILQIS